MAARTWRHFEHDADMGIGATAGSREALFESMAEGLTAIVCDPADVRARIAVSVFCEAPDDALLLVDWLNAVVYEMSTRAMLFSHFDVHLSGRALEATLWGEKVDRERHRPVVEVKGATYTALEIYEDEDGVWHACCVVDV